MSLTNELKFLINEFNLIERAQVGLKGILDNNTFEELDLNPGCQFDSKLDSFSLKIKENRADLLQVRLALFDMNIEIGYYEFETDLNGAYCDEYFVLS